MRKWLWRGLIGFALLVAAFGVAFECETHIARGWWRGEAFYDGRPTSFWRGRIDDWRTRFDSELESESWACRPRSIVMRKIVANGEEIIAVTSLDSYFVKLVGFMKNPRPPTIAERLANYVRGERDDGYGPEILAGHPEAEPVLVELSQDDKYGRVAKRALEQIEQIRKWKQQAADDGYEIIAE